MLSPVRLIRSGLCVLAALLALTGALQAGVLVVDGAGTGDFWHPVEAVTAAADGDIILIKPGDYSLGTTFIDTLGKALVLVGDTGGDAILPPTWVHDLPAGKTFVLRNVTIASGAFSALFNSSLLIGNNAGLVHIEDCTIQGLDGLPGIQAIVASPGHAGLRIFSTNCVAVHRSTIVGGKGLSTHDGPFPQLVNTVGAPAIRQEGGQLALYFVNATGGEGGAGIATGVSGQAGGHGLEADGGQAIVVGCTLTGADGGAGSTAGASGSGASASGSGVVFSELDSTLEGGAGAPPLTLPGDAQHELWPGEAWSLVLSAPVRSGSVGTLAVSGPPNELFALFFSLGMGYLPKAGFHGAFLPASPFFGPLLVVSTNGAGTFTAPFTAPTLDPFGLEGLLNIDQALMVQDTGLVLSSASAYIQVEPPN